jgi:hypothetical protein
MKISSQLANNFDYCSAELKNRSRQDAKLAKKTFS